MYKIYINETPLILLQSDQLNTYSVDSSKNLLIRYNGKPRFLLNPIDMLEKTQRWESIIIYHNDYKQLIADFESLYKIIEAAGGIVFNENGEILTMYRRKYWDLPKGKIDKGETPQVAAIREVQEETGLKVVQLEAFLYHTYHTYKTRKGKRILKKTHWYLMNTKESKVIPQTEEGIEELLWIKPVAFLKKSPLYNSIKAVVQLTV